jgi:uncharacterized protein YndB with AHSA1/START domain
MNPMTDEHIVVRMERTIPASAHRVYRAWLDPELLRRWLAPGDLGVTRVEVDERVGGHYRIWHAAGPEEVGGFECEILELVPDRRIVWRWGFVGPDRGTGPRYDSLLTVTLRDVAADATVLTLVHERLDDLAAAMPQVAAYVEPGWAMAVAKLTDTIGGEQSHAQDNR